MREAICEPVRETTVSQLGRLLVSCVGSNYEPVRKASESL